MPPVGLVRRVRSPVVAAISHHLRADRSIPVLRAGVGAHGDVYRFRWQPPSPARRRGGSPMVGVVADTPGRTRPDRERQWATGFARRYGDCPNGIGGMKAWTGMFTSLHRIDNGEPPRKVAAVVVSYLTGPMNPPAPPHTTGQCADCRHERRVNSARGSVFVLCRRAAREDAYPRYPHLPVADCLGYEPRPSALRNGS